MQSIDSESWGIVSHWSDVHCSFQNKGNATLVTTVESFFTGKSAQWFSQLFTKNGIRVSATAVETEIELKIEQQQVGSDTSILTLATEQKKQHLENARMQRVPKSKMVTALVAESVKRPKMCGDAAGGG